MMKTIFFNLIICFSITVFAQNQIRGNGDLTRITRTIDTDFNGLKGYGSIEIIVENGNHDGKVIIEAESNILEYIQTEVNDGMLFIQLKNGHNYNLKKPIKVSFNSNQLSEIYSLGSGNISTHSIQNVKEFYASAKGSANLNLKINSEKAKIEGMGSGKFHLSGETNSLEIFTRGSGTVNAYELKANDINIKKIGSGDTKVNCNGILTVDSRGSGNIFYTGLTKDINSKTLGSGKVKPYK